MRNIQKLVTLSFLIALQVLLTRFLGIETPVIRISFGFIPLALSGALFGPIAGGIVGALADLIGMMVFPKGAYFPGFTISNALSGVIYGYFLHNKPKKIFNIALAVISVMLFVNIGLNTVWLSILTKKGVYAIIGPRIIKNLIEVPIKVSCIYFVWKLVGVHLNKDIKNIAV
ncbi:folate family ECF transporter S component [Clostridium tetani]|uniref:folate family ECF transporter S component n=1 Tax=Clostridium tetani TaxID=1513 RepID=UPI00100B378F|nr:folate family ECF transporter S component [Clostridium tetani]RXM74381.1 folate transporter [Clostridium tetani]